MNYSKLHYGTIVYMIAEPLHTVYKTAKTANKKEMQGRIYS